MQRPIEKAAGVPASRRAAAAAGCALAMIVATGVRAGEAFKEPMAGLDARLTGLAIRDVAGHPSLAAQAGSLEYLRASHADALRPWGGPAGSAKWVHGPSLAAAIAHSRAVGLVEAGVETSTSALLDCLQDESRGNGLGLGGLPQLSPSALTDHCHR